MLPLHIARERHSVRREGTRGSREAELSAKMDTAVDLLNSFKSVTTANEKLVVLDQLKEVCLKASPELIPQLCTDICNLSADKSLLIRKKIIEEFAGKFVDKNTTTIPTIISMYSHLVHDRNDNVTRSLSFELARTYDKLAMHVVGMPEKQAARAQEVWQELEATALKLIGLITSDRPELTRTQCMRFGLETYVLFGVPVPKEKAAVVDPRKRGAAAAAAKAAASSSSAKAGVNLIPPKHPFLKREAIEKTAEDIFEKMETWARTRGPIEHPFTPTHMAQLTQALARVGAGRSKLWTRSADSICYMLRNMGGGGLKLEELNDKCKAQILKEAEKLCKAGKAGAEDDAVTALEKKSIMEDLQECMAAVKAGAWPAGTNKSKRALVGEKMGVAGAAAAVGDPRAKRARVAVSVEAASAIDEDPAPVDTMGSQVELSDKLVRYNDPNKSFGEGAPSAALLAIQATSGLHRLWMAHGKVSTLGKMAERAHLQLCVRSTLTVALASLNQAEGRATAAVEVITALPQTVPTALSKNVATHVPVPKPIWYFLCLHLLEVETTTPEKQKEGGAKYAHLDYIMALVDELHARDDVGDAGVDEGLSVYDAVCVALLSRLLQRSKLRSYIEEFFQRIPRVPACCLALLNLLMHAGTSDGTRAMGGGKGTKGMAISTLSTLMLTANESAARAAVRHLLHAAACADFEVRSKAVAFLSKDLVMLSGQKQYMDELRHSICSFAVAAAASAVGLHSIQCRTAERDVEGEKLPKDVSEAEAKGEEDGDAMETEEDSTVAAAAAAAAATAEEEEEEDDGRPLLLRDAEAEVDLDLPAPPLGEAAAMEAHCRRMLHLLVQLCLERTHMFSALFDIYAVAKRCQALYSGSDTSARDTYHIVTAPEPSVKEEPAVQGEEEEASASAAPVVDPTDGWAMVIKVIESDVKNVMLAAGTRAADIFDVVANTDPLARPLVVECVSYMHDNLDVPASARMVSRVKAYTEKWFTAPADLSTKARLLSTVISGEEGEAASETLRVVVDAFTTNPKKPDSAALRATFTRLVCSRPPLMSKAALVAWLVRRPETEKDRVKPCIQLCLKEQTLFSASSFHDAITDLLTDEQAPVLLLWTAIIAAQKHAPVKDLVLVRKKVWQTSKELWQGVVAAVKIFGTASKAEPTLRALLGLPAAQLQQVIKVGSAVKKPLADLLLRLSPEEREEVVSGQWAGIADESEPTRADKDKIIKKEISK